MNRVTVTFSQLRTTTDEFLLSHTFARAPESEKAGSRSQEEHMPAVAGGRLSLLQTHGPQGGEYHHQLPGESSLFMEFGASI